jgi:hypothetical protein
MTLYVGNISYTLGEEDIRNIFEVMGNVESIKLMGQTYRKIKRLLSLKCRIRKRLWTINAWMVKRWPAET